jgi:hypothetical protein
MPTYRLSLHDGLENPPCRLLELNVKNTTEAIEVASHLANACSDICLSFEIWDRERLVHRALAGGEVCSVEDLDTRRQRIVINRELALRDCRCRFARSKQLLERLDELLLAMGYLQ